MDCGLMMWIKSEINIYPGVNTGQSGGQSPRLGYVSLVSQTPNMPFIYNNISGGELIDLKSELLWKCITQST